MAIVDKQKAAIARNTAASTDLRTEIEQMTKLVVWSRECLEGQLRGTGLGYKQNYIDKTTAASVQALATSIEKLVNIKIKYDKHLKDESDKLTPEEELQALEEFFAAMSVKDRRSFLRRLVDRHNELIKGTMYHEIKISVGTKERDLDEGQD